MHEESDDEDGKEQPIAAAAVSRPDEVSSQTVGTGSALGIGCLIAVIVFVLLAFAARWLTGTW